MDAGWPIGYVEQRRDAAYANEPEGTVMEEVIKLVTQKAGISESQARMAVETVLGFLKQRLPGPLAGQLDSVIGGDGGATGDAKKGLGSMLGKL